MALSSINEFLGYGPSTPRVLFLGTEESDGGADPSRNITARLEGFEITMDLLAGTTLLASLPKFKNPFASRRRNPVQQWNRSAEIRLALAGLPWRHVRTWSRYWRTSLGRSFGDTFLMECFPFPRKEMRVRIDRYDPQREWPHRREKLKRFTNSIEPHFVVAYGAIAFERVGQLFSMQPSLWAGVTRVWHDLDGIGTIGHAGTGTVIARVGFFGHGKYKRRNTDKLAAAMIAHRGASSPLAHAWGDRPLP